MEEIKEVWEKCGEGERKIYYVSNLGQIKTITKGLKGGKEKILKGIDAGNGYLRVDICNKLILIHHLVAYAFIGERPKGLQIDHIDRCKTNNRVDNLRYCTKTENMRNRDDYREDIIVEGREERLKIFYKEREERDKVKYTCECGLTLRKNNKNRHERAQIHQNWLKNNS